MGTFTIPLKTVIEMENGNIGLDDYPIFDEKYRDSLNQKIIDHYYNQEIGQESISMFRLAMKRKMNEIMPLYNQHYILSLETVDPLSTISMETITEAVNTGNTKSAGTADATGTSASTGNNSTASNAATDSSTVTDQLTRSDGATTGRTETETNSNGSSQNSSNSHAESRAVASDTPQTALQENADYASSMQDSISDSTASGSATEQQKSTGSTDTRGTDENTTTGKTSTATEGTARETTEGETAENTATANNVKNSENIDTRANTDVNTKVSGYQGHAPILIMQARQALVNVDMMVINELRDLFMLIWSNNDSYTGRNFPYYGFFR